MVDSGKVLLVMALVVIRFTLVVLKVEGARMLDYQ